MNRNCITLEKVEIEGTHKLHEKALQDKQRVFAFLIQQTEANKCLKKIVRKKKTVLDEIQTQAEQQYPHKNLNNFNPINT
jgi:hypothetical protein